MRRIVPCRQCGHPAGELELPQLEGIGAQIFRQVIRLVAAKQGILLSAEQCENPLEEIDGKVIAELLALVCVDCVERRARPSLQVGM